MIYLEPRIMSRDTKEWGGGWAVANTHHFRNTALQTHYETTVAERRSRV